MTTILIMMTLTMLAVRVAFGLGKRVAQFRPATIKMSDHWLNDNKYN